MDTSLPPLFVSHGSPMTAVEPGPAGAFWRRLGASIDATFGRPKAIVALSAHSLTREPALLAAARHATVHDFGGFPDELYRLRYDAPGAPDLAPRVHDLLARAGIASHVVDDGGLDHGIWVPLRFAWPDADVPVLPLAWVPTQPPAAQFALGAALAPLADEGVLVVGTGSITHNLRLLGDVTGRGPAAQPERAESAAFRAWFAERAAARDWDALFDYRRQAPHAALMHPSDEHLLPWYGAAGVGGRAHAPRRLFANVTYGALGMDAYAFGPAAERLVQALPAG
ncbi:MAG: dioxygenase [Burkholderiaceae bacterium]|nr:dioxygenase [Burkholderiaceae bacterium]